MPTVRDVTFDLLRALDLTTIVGNPGSTEETFLKNFPQDFTYIMALQESSVVGIADGVSQGLKKPIIVNVHTGAGMGNAMGCILTAYLNKTPLIITAGQQTREMLLMEPFLTNVDGTNLPKPWVKWSYEPSRAEDVPGAFMRAYASAIQQPTGPVFLSLPLDDWDKEMPQGDYLRTVAHCIGPDPRRIDEFAQKINASDNPVLIYGGDIARSNGWDAGIQLAELLNVPVWSAPFIERNVFPEGHALYKGILPAAIGPLSEKLASHDLVVVIGAPVFRYYPWVPGDYLPQGAELLHVTDSPYEAAKAAVGSSLVSDARLALIELSKLVNQRSVTDKSNTSYRENKAVEPIKYPLTAQNVFDSLSANLPERYILVQESPSNVQELSASKLGIINEPDSYYAMSSGGLGWDMPAAIGLAFSEQQSNRNRPVILIMGDGSFQYSPQAIWTGVQQYLHVIVIVLRNEEYGILKSFALLEDTPNVPGLDLPGLDSIAIAQGYGAAAYHVKTVDELQSRFQEALQHTKGVTVIEIPIDKKILPLIR